MCILCNSIPPPAEKCFSPPPPLSLRNPTTPCLSQEESARGHKKTPSLSLSGFPFPLRTSPDSGIVSKLIGKVILTLVIINATTSPPSEPLASRNELKCPPATHFSDAGEHFWLLGMFKLDWESNVHLLNTILLFFQWFFFSFKWENKLNLRYNA